MKGALTARMILTRRRGERSTGIEGELLVSPTGEYINPGERTMYTSYTYK
jgi:hypothetical protein